MVYIVNHSDDICIIFQKTYEYSIVRFSCRPTIKFGKSRADLELSEKGVVMIDKNTTNIEKAIFKRSGACGIPGADQITNTSIIRIFRAFLKWKALLLHFPRKKNTSCRYYSQIHHIKELWRKGE